MSVSLERQLQSEKIQRKDISSYLGDQLIRQRLVNEEVLGFVEQYIPVNGRVIDACAGPEGSYLAAMRRGLHWVGNDISIRFAHALKHTGANVVISDFTQSFFKDDSADATLFVLALNNINDPKAALREAKRVTKHGGIIVEAEPGISSWTGKIILHSLLTDNVSDGGLEYLSSRGSREKIEEQFKDKPYSETEYVNLLLSNALGLTRDEAAVQLKYLLSSSPKAKVFFRFHQYLTQKYFSHARNVFSELGLQPIRCGVMVMGRVGEDWVVTSAVEVPINDWDQEVIQVRAWNVRQSSTVQQYPRSLDRASERIITPVICLLNAK